FNAVGYGENAGLLALATVLKQHDAIWHQCLLDSAIIQKFSLVFGRHAARKTFFVLQPKHPERSGADVVTSLSLLFIEQIDHVKIETFLGVLTDQTDGETTLFVAQQGFE